MNLVHGLAVAFILFEGFIIQCEAVDKFENAPIIGVNANQPNLPNDLIEVILHKSGLQTTKKAGQALMTDISEGAMRKIFRDHILLITSTIEYDLYGGTTEHTKNGDLYMEFGNYDRLVSLFQKFGKDARRMRLDYRYFENYDLINEINKNIIHEYANYFTELTIITSIKNDTIMWEEISNGTGEIHFPEVKKFIYAANSKMESFDLNSIFPKLESFVFFGTLVDKNCLANVRNLKEFTMRTTALEHHHLDHIFENNKQISTLSVLPKKIEILRSICKHLKNLEKLVFGKPGREALFRASGHPIYNLTTVTSFDVIFNDSSDLIGDLSFDMPNLKSLYFLGERTDSQITNFIKHFKNLELVDIRAKDTHDFDFAECIGKLVHLKEVTIGYKNFQLSALTHFFENFDKKKSNLKTLKLLEFNTGFFSDFEDAMHETNLRLKRSLNPTWTLSYDIQNRCLTCKRDI